MDVVNVLHIAYIGDIGHIVGVGGNPEADLAFGQSPVRGGRIVTNVHISRDINMRTGALLVACALARSTACLASL